MFRSARLVQAITAQKLRRSLSTPARGVICSSPKPTRRSFSNYSPPKFTTPQKYFVMASGVVGLLSFGWSYFSMEDEKQGSSDEAVLQLTGALGKALDGENSLQEVKEVMDVKSLHAAKGLRDLANFYKSHPSFLPLPSSPIPRWSGYEFRTTDPRPLHPTKGLTLLYFTGKWCPPCKEFTPMLKKFYESANEESSDTKNLEIVVIPCVKEEDLLEEMEGLTLLLDKDVPFSTVTGPTNSFITYLPQVENFYTLAKFYYSVWAGPRDGKKFGGGGSRGIPTVILIDGKGEPVTMLARNDVVKGIRGGMVEEIMEYWRDGLVKKKAWDEEMKKKDVKVEDVDWGPPDTKKG